jgi:hypothetical protein
MRPEQQSSEIPRRGAAGAAGRDRVSNHMMSREFSLDKIDVIGPDHYAKNGYPHAEWAYLRKHQPVFRVERPNVDPFWQSPNMPTLSTSRASRTCGTTARAWRFSPAS